MDSECRGSIRITFMVLVIAMCVAIVFVDIRYGSLNDSVGKIHKLTEDLFDFVEYKDKPTSEEYNNHPTENVYTGETPSTNIDQDNIINGDNNQVTVINNYYTSDESNTSGK